jgi:hypothetical protein
VDGFAYVQHRLRCIILYDKEERELTTFDTNTKIQVYLHKNQYINKILESASYLNELDIHKHVVDLYHPAFDIKVGYSFEEKTYYAKFVLLCKDYKIYQKVKGKKLKKFLDNVSLEKDVRCYEEFFKVLNEAKILEKVQILLEENKYFGWTSTEEFFKKNEFLFWRNMPVKKTLLIVKTDKSIILNKENEEKQVNENDWINENEIMRLFTINSKNPSQELKSPETKKDNLSQLSNLPHSQKLVHTYIQNKINSTDMFKDKENFADKIKTKTKIDKTIQEIIKNID